MVRPRQSGRGSPGRGSAGRGSPGRDGAGRSGSGRGGRVVAARDVAAAASRASRAGVAVERARPGVTRAVPGAVGRRAAARRGAGSPGAPVRPLAVGSADVRSRAVRRCVSC